MNIQLDPTTTTNSESDRSQAVSQSRPRQARGPAGTNASTGTQPATVPHAADGTSITFRQDSNGRLYYVVADSQSGREIQELPPSAVRAVGQTIDEILKASNNKPHIDLRG